MNRVSDETFFSFLNRSSTHLRYCLRSHEWPWWTSSLLLVTSRTIRYGHYSIDFYPFPQTYILITKCSKTTLACPSIWFFLPASRTAGGRKNSNQVQCCTLVGIIWKKDFFRCTKLLLRSASCSPRCSSPCCFRHRRRTGMNLTKYVLWLDRR